MARKNKIPKNDFECDVVTEVCEFTDEPVLPKGCKEVNSFSFEDDADVNTGADIVFADTDIINSDAKNNSNIDDFKTNPDSDNTPAVSPISNSVADIGYISKIEKLQKISSLEDNRKTPIANGAAPAIDGEAPTIRRCYVLRASTIRKINEIKSIHPDIGICVSTIVDMAIDYYYANIH